MGIEEESYQCCQLRQYADLTKASRACDDVLISPQFEWPNKNFASNIMKYSVEGNEKKVLIE